MEPFGLSIPLKTLALLVFYFSSIIFIVFSAIFYFHWNSYSPDDKVTKITLITFFSINLPLVIALGITALII